MRRYAILIMVLLATASLGPRAASGFCGGTPNCLGIYFDPETYQYPCMDHITPFVALNFYFVVKNCDLEQVSGFEFAWRIEPSPLYDPIVGEIWLPGETTATPDPYNLIVTLNQPVAASDPFLLARITLLFLSDPGGPVFYTGPSDPATVPTRAVVFVPGDPPTPTPLSLGETTSPNGWTNNPVAGVGFNCQPDPVETTTWSAVKALYH